MTQPVRPILYVVEFGPDEPAITAQVAALAKAWRCQVQLLLRLGPRYELWQAGEPERIAAETRLTRLARRLRSQRVRLHGQEVTTGNLASRALDLAETVQARLILLGSGADGEELSATARQLASYSFCDVWIGRPQVLPLLEHVLVPVDGSAASAAALRWAIDFCRLFNARLMALSVLHPPVYEQAAQDRAARDQLVAHRVAFLRQFDFAGVPYAERFVWAEQASPGIVEVAAAYPEGLVVLGVGGQRRFGRQMLGTTSSAVLERLPGSVLVLQERG